MAIIVTFVPDVPNFTILNSWSFILNTSLRQDSSLATLERLLVSQEPKNKIIQKHYKSLARCYIAKTRLASVLNIKIQF
jgi:hypothetical protein